MSRSGSTGGVRRVAWATMRPRRPHRRPGRGRQLKIAAAAVLVSYFVNPAGAQQHVDPSTYAIHDMRTGQPSDLAALAAVLAAADVVFAGEQHDDSVTHRLQLELLELIGQRRNGVVVALEMFERDVQPLIDGYLTGTTTETVMLEGARPWPRYRTDYSPLVELARTHGWPVVAANVPRPIASLVARSGMPAIATLDSAQRSHVAAAIRCPADRYYERFAHTMQGHTPPPGAADEFPAVDRYYDSQCVKDETMAESVVRALHAGGPGTLVVHFNGSFHSDYRLGAAERVMRRAPEVNMIVVSMIPVPDVTAADPAAHAGIADFIVFTQRRR